jgi:hypothetical protein
MSSWNVSTSLLISPPILIPYRSVTPSRLLSISVHHRAAILARLILDLRLVQAALRTVVILAITILKQSCSRAIPLTGKATTRTATKASMAMSIQTHITQRRTTIRTSESGPRLRITSILMLFINRSSFNGPSATGPHAGTASPGGRSGHGVADPSAPEPFPPPSTSPGARQMSHDIPGHHGYDQYYSGAQSSYGNYDSYSSQYGADNAQPASASSWNSSAHQK